MKEELDLKQLCKELGLTYKELGEKIGYGFEAVSKASQSGNVSAPMKRAIELYKETLELKEKLQKMEDFKRILKEWVQ